MQDVSEYLCWNRGVCLSAVSFRGLLVDINTSEMPASIVCFHLDLLITMDSSKVLAELEAHLSNTQAKLYRPDNTEYTKLQECFIDKRIQTLATVRPQTAEDVSSALQFCLKNNIDFCVRTGGHDCASRTLVHGALVIDMRDIKHVTISDTKQTAKVGGGVLSGELCEILGKEGLTTPV